MPSSPDERIAAGVSQIVVRVSSYPIQVFTYKPRSYHPATSPLLVVFHGILRNAGEYRDDARGLGDRLGALVIAPQFDLERFPTDKYQRGGIFREDGTLAPRAEWTYALVPQIVDQVRAIESRPEMPCYFIGHSAGGQFVVRMAAFSDVSGARLVAANAGSYLFATRDMPFAYGFGNLPTELSDDAALRRYLAKPLTLYLGTADDHPDEHFDASPQAMLQGESRYERGQKSFALAQRLAQENGWEFNWRLVIVQGIHHDHLKMFNAPKARDAVLGT